jgi:A/G-specific adenine glycosylase
MPSRRPASTAPTLQLSPQRLGRIRTLLLEWYDDHEQEFPWRDARNPYFALVAAVASQQTQMPRVLEIFDRWVAAFPTIEACAAASRAEVLRVWERAGYPRRAVNLHETARICVERYDGALPREREALLALPGIGPFTMAIVANFGFGDDVAAVDTNIVRVLGRVAVGDLQPATETPRKTIDALAERMLRPGTATRWNPALMDYGARVCTPRPRCEACVVAHLCAARPRFAAGEVAEPVRAQGAFAGSDREWRGRLMQALREHDLDASERGTGRGWTVSRLLDRVASTAVERATARRLLDALAADGLAWVDGERCGLGARRG